MTKHKNIASSVLKLYISFVTLALGLALSARAALAQDPSAFLWQASYWNNTSLSGDPALVRRDADIAFNWTTSSPAPGVQADKFSVRWRRTVNLPAGTYRFAMTVDDGGRLWVNGHFEAFKDQPEAATIVDVVPPFVVPRIWLPFVAKE